jgi:hypothetical protein
LALGAREVFGVPVLLRARGSLFFTNRDTKGLSDLKKWLTKNNILAA